VNITSDIVAAYLKCPTKCFLRAHGESGSGNEYADWVQTESKAYRVQGLRRMTAGIPTDDCATGVGATENFKKARWRVAVDLAVRMKNLESQIHAVERIPPEGWGKPAQFIPIRFIFTNKLSKDDKLLVAYDALVLSELLGRTVGLGKIIHGDDHSTLKVKTVGVRIRVIKHTEKIAALLSADDPPDLVLNRHCGECEFRARCRQKAVEKDALSLLSGIAEKECRKLNSKGIFTVTQLSYTFRPRRRPKRLRDKREKYHHSLKALAVREKKIHIVGSPAFKVEGTPVYIDIEGVPDRDFYYLIGLRVHATESAVQHSLWADEEDDERSIWDRFLGILDRVRDPVLIHYGSFETTFLKRMRERYGKPTEGAPLTHVLSSSVNLLSVIFAQIYFPCFSNGLKDIARNLGFSWTDTEASGLNSVVWRHQWQRTRDPRVKEMLVRYNTEDCAALGLVTETVSQITGSRLGGEIEVAGRGVVQADSVIAQKPSPWRKFASPLPSLEHVNAAAHWDYQRNRVYARSGGTPMRPRLPWLRQRKQRRADKVILWPIVPICPQCSRRVRVKGPLRSRTLQDVVFGRFSLKRRFVTYVFQTYRCNKCGIVFGFPERYRIYRKHGWDLVTYFLYQFVELCIPQMTVVQSYNRLFGYGIHRSSLNNIKTKAAAYYAGTKQQILDRIVRGSLIHADETRANIKGKSAYVWVLTNLHEVIYIYAETRDGEIVRRFLADFNGVLVTDFYAAYDSIDCPQQRCLIHLVRDLNDEMMSNPFDKELKQIVSAFGELLKRMVASVDRHGLKKRFLGKHLVEVDRFYRLISHMGCQSEAAVKCVQRFERNRDKLFTFLRFDGVPWNNNNAEHAIKAFARLRDVIAGTSTAKGVEEYLTLLSVCQTCKYRGLDFLDFLRSGEKDIEIFAQSRRRRRAGGQS